MAKKQPQPTFAERAKAIMKRYGFNEKTGKFLREDDPISTASMNMELAKLREEQEMQKHTQELEMIKSGQELDGMPMMAYGGSIPPGYGPMNYPYSQMYMGPLPTDGIDPFGYSLPQYGYVKPQHPVPTIIGKPAGSLRSPSLGQPILESPSHPVSPFGIVAQPPDSLRQNVGVTVTPINQDNRPGNVTYRPGYTKDSRVLPDSETSLSPLPRFIQADYRRAVPQPDEAPVNDVAYEPKIGDASIIPDLDVPIMIGDELLMHDGSALLGTPYDITAPSIEQVPTGEANKTGLLGKFATKWDAKDMGVQNMFQNNPYLATAAATQLLGTAAKMAIYAGRDKYKPIEFQATPIDEFEGVDNSEAVKGIRAAAAGAKGAIKRGTGSRGELIGNLGSLSSSEMSAVAQNEEQTAAQNAAAKNAYNMQVAQIKMEDAKRKLQTGMINKEMYDQITANWMGIINEGVSGLSGVMKDYNSAEMNRNMVLASGTGDYTFMEVPKTGSVGKQLVKAIKQEDGSWAYVDPQTGKIVKITK